LNPTGGVMRKQPLGGLDYRPDPSRPGGGVFVARGQAKGRYGDVPAGTIASDDEESEGEAAATATPASSAFVTLTNDHILKRASFSNLGMLPSPFISPLTFTSTTTITNPVNAQLGANHGQQAVAHGSGSAPMVTFTPLGRANVNPAMDVQSVPNNQVINILDTPQASNTLAEFAMADNGFLEGIPASMFDWSELFELSRHPDFPLTTFFSRPMGQLFCTVQCTNS
jgi:hypothetical protein